MVVFSQDIAGLEVDSPVKFRGVPVGRVASIHLSIGSPEAPLQEMFMPVVIELNQSRIREMGETTDLGNPEVVKTLVDHGLRARLALESFLSGRRYVDLDIVSDAEPPQPPPFPLPYPAIPVQVEPGLLSLQSDAARVLGKLQALDLEGLVADLRAAAQGREPGLGAHRRGRAGAAAHAREHGPGARRHPRRGPVAREGGPGRGRGRPRARCSGSPRRSTSSTGRSAR